MTNVPVRTGLYQLVALLYPNNGGHLAPQEPGRAGIQEPAGDPQDDAEDLDHPGEGEVGKGGPVVGIRRGNEGSDGPQHRQEHAEDPGGLHPDHGRSGRDHPNGGTPLRQSKAPDQESEDDPRETYSGPDLDEEERQHGRPRSSPRTIALP